MFVTYHDFLYGGKIMADLTQNNYVLAQSFNRANVQDRLWYVMDESDLDTLKDEQTIAFGDKAYVIKTKALYIMGNDDTWYEM